MRRIDLDYRHPAVRTSRLGYALLLAGGLAAAVAAADYLALQGDLASVTAQNEQLRQRLEQVRRQAGAATPATATQRQAAQAAARQLALPWAGLLDAVETSDTGDVVLLAMAPNAQTGQVKLSAEAQSLAAALRYVARLEETAALGNVRLLNQQVQEEPGRPLRIEVLADWGRGP